MGKKIFESEKITDILTTEFIQKSGMKIGKFYNNAIINWFLPESEKLRIEALYLLELESKNNLNQAIMQQSLSRGITWLSKYPIENCDILKTILLYFTCSPYTQTQKDPRNENVKKIFENAELIIKQYNQDYNPIHPCIGNFGEDICDYWNFVWNDKIMYEVISSIVYLAEPQKPFTCYEAVILLKEIENSAKNKYGVK